MQRCITHGLLLLSLLGAVPGAKAAQAGPEAWVGLDAERLDAPAPRELLDRIERGRARRADLARDPAPPPGTRRALGLSSSARLDLDLGAARTQRHANGDWSLNGPSADGAGTVHLTVGEAGLFGQIVHGDRRWLITSGATGSWRLELPRQGIRYNNCGTQHPAARIPFPVRLEQTGDRRTATTEDDQQGHTVIDLLLIYNQALRQRYPGTLLETRLNHLVSIANQIMANSELPIAIRLVGHQLYPYSNDTSNERFLDDITATLSGDTRRGLEGLRSLRDSLGADLIIGLRPHDIEKRGNCGLAFFPANNPDFGANVVSDGMSSWSACLDDVLTHEIGHNLGAGHQLGQGGAFFDPRGSALARVGQYNTVMGSFGTGRADRFYGLPAFSNPDILCGDRPCGDEFTDNAAVIRALRSAVAAYRPAVSNLPVPQVGRSLPDSDGDGADDWLDHFPFDASEQADWDLDGVGDGGDAFPFDATEQFDNDGDGIGDHLDQDDDNDGVADAEDRFPLDSLESEDSDLDGIGDVGDRFPTDDDEIADRDGDGVGDNADPDDDGDGVPEFHDTDQDLLVVSIGNSRVLRFDAGSGEPRGVEVPPWDALLTFQSALDFRSSDRQLLYTADSALRRMQLQSRALLGAWVPAFGDGDGAPELGTGFPTGLAVNREQSRLAVTRLDDPVLARFRGAERPFRDDFPFWVLDGEEAPRDVVADGSQTYVLAPESRSLWVADSLGVRRLGPGGAAWMQEPRRMALSGDGRLLISDAGRHAVVAVDQQTGAYLGDLADLAALGYADPDGVAVTADGTLLVGAAGQDAILAFDAASGEFLGERVPPGSEGLDEPGDLLLVPRLVDRFGGDPSWTLKPNAGLWSSPTSDGRGFDIQVAGPRLTALWYTYDADGLPTWYLAAGFLEAGVFEQTLQRYTLDADGLASSEPVGSLRIEFASERTADLSYDLFGAVGEERLDWLQASPEPLRLDHTGVWRREDGPGWGLSLARQGEILVAVAYLYDSAGQPRWLLSDPVPAGLQPILPMRAYLSTGLCPGCTGPIELETRLAGDMRLTLPGLDASPQDSARGAWSSDLELPPPLMGDWRLDEVPMIRFSDLAARPR